jgi:hypothetical protein
MDGDQSRRVAAYPEQGTEPVGDRAATTATASWRTAVPAACFTGRIIGEFLPLDLHFSFDHLLLCPYRDMPACRHREGSSPQARYPGQPHSGRVPRCSGHAEHQRQVGEESVAGPAYGGTRCAPWTLR